MSGDCSLCKDSLLAPSALPQYRLVYQSRQIIKMKKEVTQANVVVAKCGHVFHNRCLTNHLKSRQGLLPAPYKLRNAGLCPQPGCQTKILIRELHPVNFAGHPQPLPSLAGSVNRPPGGNCPYCHSNLHGPFAGAPCPLQKRNKFPHLASSNICCTPCGHLYHTNCFLKDLTDETVQTNMRNTGMCITCAAKVYIKQTHPVSFHRPVARYGLPTPMQQPGFQPAPAVPRAVIPAPAVPRAVVPAPAVPPAVVPPPVIPATASPSSGTGAQSGGVPGTPSPAVGTLPPASSPSPQGPASGGTGATPPAP